MQFVGVGETAAQDEPELRARQAVADGDDAQACDLGKDQPLGAGLEGVGSPRCRGQGRDECGHSSRGRGVRG